MNDKQLECFVRVAGFQSFRAAAQSLYVSQPAVTQQIKSLEKLLGVTLFERDTTHVRLTVEGERFLARAIPLLQALRGAENMFRDEAPLTLNYFFSDRLGDVARAFRANEPRARLRLARIKSIHHMDAMVKAPDSVTFIEQGLLAGIPDAVFIPIWDVCEQIVACPQSPLATLPSCTTADLKGQTLLRYFAPGAELDTGLDLYTRRELASSPSIRCGSVNEALDMVRADCGVALLLLPEETETPGLARIPLEPKTRTSLGLAYLKEHETPQVLALVRAIQDVYGTGETAGRPLVLM